MEPADTARQLPNCEAFPLTPTLYEGAPVTVPTTRAPTAMTMQFAGIATAAVVVGPVNATSVSRRPNWIDAPLGPCATVVNAPGAIWSAIVHPLAPLLSSPT